jgi:hypothetical protein
LSCDAPPPVRTVGNMPDQRSSIADPASLIQHAPRARRTGKRTGSSPGDGPSPPGNGTALLLFSYGVGHIRPRQWSGRAAAKRGPRYSRTARRSAPAAEEHGATRPRSAARSLSCKQSGRHAARAASPSERSRDVREASSAEGEESDRGAGTNPAPVSPIGPRRHRRRRGGSWPAPKLFLDNSGARAASCCLGAGREACFRAVGCPAPGPLTAARQ